MPEIRGSQGFSEFHARDLFKGTGEFATIPENKRFLAIRAVLDLCVSTWGLTVVYGAVDRVKLEETLVATIEPADVAFRTCILGIEKWMVSNQTQVEYEDKLGVANDLCLLILDDTDDLKLKMRLRQTYRILRKRMQFSDKPRGQLAHLHDSLYFGDSRDSIGIQLADLCAYFIGLHLIGDESGSAFYDIFKDRIIFSGIFPEE